MNRPFLRSLERTFDLDEVTVSGPPSIHHRRLAAGPTRRYAPPAFEPSPPELTPATAPEPAPEAEPAPAPEPPPPPAPGPTLAELQAAVAEARAEAVERTAAQVRAEVEDSLKAREVAALEGLGRRLDDHHAAYRTILAGLRDQAHELIVEVARAVAPRAIARAPLADVEHLLEDLMPCLDAEPKLELALAPDLVPAGREILARIATTSGFRGEVVVAADPAMALGDAHLAWRRGDAVRDVGALTEQALQIALRWLEPPTGSKTDTARERRMDAGGSLP